MFKLPPLGPPELPLKKVVLLMKQLGQRGRGEAYARPCSLSYDRLHLQHPKVYNM